MAQARLKYIDIAKFLFIFLLFIEHTGNWLSLNGLYNYIKIWICSFHMPAFFIVYGMVVSTQSIRSKKDVLNFIRKKFSSLIVPYFLWTMIYAPSINTNFFKGILWGTNLSLGTAQTNQVLWFLPTMFLATVIFQVIVELLNLPVSNKKRLILCDGLIILCGCTSLLLKNKGGSWGWFSNFDISLTGVLFIILGYLLKQIFHKLYSKPNYTILLLGCTCLCFGFVFAQLNPPPECWVTIMALAFYGKSYIFFCFIAFLNTIAICCFSILLEKITLLSWLGEGSLFLMAVHYIIFPYTTIWASHLAANGIVIAVINATFCTIICIPLLFLVNHYIPVLKGK